MTTIQANADSTKQLIEIAAEMNISPEHITNVRQCSGFLSFNINGAEYTNKLTKTGKHKKNSIRRASW
jgi:hypothetical protein